MRHSVLRILCERVSLRSVALKKKKNKTHWILKTNETEIVSFLNNFNWDFMKFHY